MAKELNEDTGFTVSIKTLAGIGAGIATVVSMWFALQADIAEAKELRETVHSIVNASNQANQAAKVPEMPKLKKK